MEVHGKEVFLEKELSWRDGNMKLNSSNNPDYFE